MLLKSVVVVALWSGATWPAFGSCHWSGPFAAAQDVQQQDADPLAPVRGLLGRPQQLERLYRGLYLYSDETTAADGEDAAEGCGLAAGTGMGAGRSQSTASGARTASSTATYRRPPLSSYLVSDRYGYSRYRESRVALAKDVQAGSNEDRAAPAGSNDDVGTSAGAAAAAGAETSGPSVADTRGGSYPSVADLMSLLHAQQHPNPSTCKDRRLLLIQFSPTAFEGIGSILKSVMIGLAEAAWSNRTLVWGGDLPYMYEHSRGVWGRFRGNDTGTGTGAARATGSGAGEGTGRTNGSSHSTVSIAGLELDCSGWDVRGHRHGIGGDVKGQGQGHGQGNDGQAGTTAKDGGSENSLPNGGPYACFFQSLSSCSLADVKDEEVEWLGGRRWSARGGQARSGTGASTGTGGDVSSGAPVDQATRALDTTLFDQEDPLASYHHARPAVATRKAGRTRKVGSSNGNNNAGSSASGGYPGSLGHVRHGFEDSGRVAIQQVRRGGIASYMGPPPRWQEHDSVRIRARLRVHSRPGPGINGTGQGHDRTASEHGSLDYDYHTGRYDADPTLRQRWAAALAAYSFRLKPELVEQFEARRALALNWTMAVDAGQDGLHDSTDAQGDSQHGHGNGHQTDSANDYAHAHAARSALPPPAPWAMHIRHGDVSALSDVYGNRRVHSFGAFFERATELASAIAQARAVESSRHVNGRIAGAQGSTRRQASSLALLPLPSHIYVASDDTKTRKLAKAAAAAVAGRWPAAGVDVAGVADAQSQAAATGTAADGQTVQRPVMLTWPSKDLVVSRPLSSQASPCSTGNHQANGLASTAGANTFTGSTRGRINANSNNTNTTITIPARFTSPHGSHTAVSDGGCIGSTCALRPHDVLRYRGISAAAEASGDSRAARILRVLAESIEDLYLLSLADVILTQGTSHYSTLAVLLGWARTDALYAPHSGHYLDETSIAVGEVQTGYLHGKLNGTSAQPTELGWRRWASHHRRFVEGLPDAQWGDVSLPMQRPGSVDRLSDAHSHTLPAAAAGAAGGTESVGVSADGTTDTVLASHTSATAPPRPSALALLSRCSSGEESPSLDRDHGRHVFGAGGGPFRLGWPYGPSTGRAVGDSGVGTDGDGAGGQGQSSGTPSHEGAAIATHNSTAPEHDGLPWLDPAVFYNAALRWLGNPSAESARVPWPGECPPAWMVYQAVREARRARDQQTAASAAAATQQATGTNGATADSAHAPQAQPQSQLSGLAAQLTSAQALRKFAVGYINAGAGHWQWHHGQALECWAAAAVALTAAEDEHGRQWAVEQGRGQGTQGQGMQGRAREAPAATSGTTGGTTGTSSGAQPAPAASVQHRPRPFTDPPTSADLWDVLSGNSQALCEEYCHPYA